MGLQLIPGPMQVPQDRARHPKGSTAKERKGKCGCATKPIAVPEQNAQMQTVQMPNARYQKRVAHMHKMANAQTTNAQTTNAHVFFVSDAKHQTTNVPLQMHPTAFELPRAKHTSHRRCHVQD